MVDEDWASNCHHDMTIPNGKEGTVLLNKDGFV